MADETKPASETGPIPVERVYQEFASEIRYEGEQFRSYLNQFVLAEGALITAVLWKSLTDLQILAVELAGVLFAATFGVTLRRSIARQRGLSRRISDLCSSHAQLASLPLGETKSAVLSWAKNAPLMWFPHVCVVGWLFAFAWHFVMESHHTSLQRVLEFIGATVAASFYWGLSSSRRSRLFDDFAADEETEWLAHLSKTTESERSTVTSLTQKEVENDDSSG